MKPLGIVAQVLVLMFAFACGGGGSSSPSSPSTPSPPPPTPVVTRIISLPNEPAFCVVEVGGSVQLGLGIENTGTAPLTVTGITFSAHETVFTVSPTFPFPNTIAPGMAVYPRLQFAPASAQSYTGVLTVHGNQTSGNNTLNYSGVGTPPTSLWTLSGSGDKAFDMPAKVRNFLFVADYTGDRAEVTYYADGRQQFPAEVIGTASGVTHFEQPSIRLCRPEAPGSDTRFEVKTAAGVRWSFTERKQSGSHW